MESVWRERLTRHGRLVAVAAGLGAATTLALAGAAGVGEAQSGKGDDSNGVGSGHFQFTPLPTSAECTPGGDPAQPFVLPTGYAQTVFASEGDGGTKDLWDMNTQNETGEQAGRFLYRTHETSSGSQVSVTDLETNSTRVLAEREDWERFDGIVWTPWGTILAAEEVNRSAAPDPEVPQAQAGLVYEFFLDPDDPTQLDESINQDGETPGVVPRPALGSKSHEGMRFDPQGNLYSISESNPGYVFRFVPDNQNEQNNDPSSGEDDLSSREDNLSNGQLYALKVTEPTGDRTGEAVWQPLDRAAVQVNATTEATAEQATGYNRPEDVELTTSTGNNATGTGANTVYVSITGEGDNRVLGIDLREPASGSEHLSAFVYDYVRVGENAPEDFEAPDNLALDRNGNLYITEDPPQNPPGKGADIWVAEPPSQRGEQPLPAENVVRFASLTDCNAEPTGIYFKMTGRPGGDGDGAAVDQNSETLFVNVQHRGGDGRDLAVAITQAQEGSSSRSAGDATDPPRTTESTTTSQKTEASEKTKER